MCDFLRVLDIVPGTSVDGEGLRTAIYFAGCKHACHGCHNPQSWDMEGGVEMSVDEIMDKIMSEELPVTFSGGDPLYQPVEAIVELAKRIKQANLGLWCYTGFLYEQVKNHKLMEYVDVLVDGPFVEALRDTGLLFRGSSNQRILSLSGSEPKPWSSGF